MQTHLLIDAIVQQTTVLIARLSTAAGIRAPLSHIADQVFVDLAAQIEAQGVSRKVAADMFGLALRTYQKKVSRIIGAQSNDATTLWQGILEFLSRNGSATRMEIFEEFPRDDPQSIGAVLADLLSSGLAYRAGSSDNARYGMTPEAELQKLMKGEQSEAWAAMLWLKIYRAGTISVSELSQVLNVPAAEVRAAACALQAQGRVQVSDDEDALLSAAQFVIPVGSSEGWEAAVFDHFQAMCNAVAQKLSSGTRQSALKDIVGGTTLTFHVHREHPYYEEVTQLLGSVRAQTDALWEKVAAYNREHGRHQEAEKVSFYAGQWVGEPEQ